MGAVANSHMYVMTKKKQVVSKVFDLSSAIDFQGLLYDRDRALVIWGIDFLFVTENASAGSASIVGTVASGAIVSNICTATLGASQTIGDVVAGTLLTTLQSANGLHFGRPIVPAATPIAFKNAASGGAGEVQVVISYYPIDPNGNNY